MLVVLERQLAGMSVERRVDPGLARQVAEQLTARDALAAHTRNELGFADATTARPLQAAGVSAVAFTCGAVLAIVALLLAPPAARVVVIVAVAVAGLALLGWLGAAAGRAPWRRLTVRVVAGGALAMAVMQASAYSLTPPGSERVAGAVELGHTSGRHRFGALLVGRSRGGRRAACRPRADTRPVRGGQLTRRCADGASSDEPPGLSSAVAWRPHRK